MLDPVSGAEAFIRPYDSEDPYTEYDPPPGSLLDAVGDQNRFIEAVTGDRIAMDVKLPADFDFQGCAAIQTSCYFYAGGTISTVHCQDSFARDPTQSQHYMFTADTFIAYAWFWRRARNQFCGLRMVEASTDNMKDADAEARKRMSSKRSLNAELKCRGRIVVAISFGQHGGKETPVTNSINNQLQEFVISNAAAIDHGRSHTLEPIYLGRANQPKPVTCFIADANIRPIFLTFYYVSRAFLQKQNIVQAGRPSFTLKEQQVKHFSTLRLTSRSRTGSKRKASEMCDHGDEDVDDDEPLPTPRIKVDDPIDDQDQPSSINPPAATSFAAAEAITRAPADDAAAEQPRRAARVTPLDPAAHLPTTSTPAQREKARRRAILQLKLEEIAIKRELLELEAE